MQKIYVELIQFRFYIKLKNNENKCIQLCLIPITCSLKETKKKNE